MLLIFDLDFINLKLGKERSLNFQFESPLWIPFLSKIFCSTFLHFTLLKTAPGTQSDLVKATVRHPRVTAIEKELEHYGIMKR